MWKTENGRRPDLEALTVNPPTEYVGKYAFPAEAKTQRSGTVYFMTVQTDQSAQSGRTIAGGTINTNYLASSNTTFSCVEKLGRFAVPAGEVDDMGGVEKSDVVGGTMAKRSVMAAIEGAQAIALQGGTSTLAYATYGDLFALVEAGLKSIRRYSGKTALFVSATTYRNIIQLPEVAQRLAFTGFNFANPADALSITPDCLKNLLKGVFGIDEIFVGDDTYWEQSGYTDRAVVCKLPSDMELSYKMGAELGKTFVYETEGNQFAIETYADENTRANVYDGVSFVDVKVLNDGARKVLTGFAAAEKRPTIITLNGGTV